MANQDRGTKREDPETGKKFYDLNRDPIVSPYTGKSYPRSFFEQPAQRSKPAAEADESETESESEAEVETEEAAEPGRPEIVSLEEADAEESGEDEDIPEVDDVEDVEDIGEDDADVFLEDDEEDDDDLDFDVDDGDDR